MKAAIGQVLASGMTADNLMERMAAAIKAEEEAAFKPRAPTSDFHGAREPRSFALHELSRYHAVPADWRAIASAITDMLQAPRHEIRTLALERILNDRRCVLPELLR